MEGREEWQAKEEEMEEVAMEETKQDVEVSLEGTKSSRRTVAGNSKEGRRRAAGKGGDTREEEAGVNGRRRTFFGADAVFGRRGRRKEEPSFLPSLSLPPSHLLSYLGPQRTRRRFKAAALAAARRAGGGGGGGSGGGCCCCCCCCCRCRPGLFSPRCAGRQEQPEGYGWRPHFVKLV